MLEKIFHKDTEIPTPPENGKPRRTTARLNPHPREAGFSTRSLVYGFALIILIGTLLLMLPFASQSGEVTSPVDALFTATSATCVTGLVTVDTGTHWSFFGQAIILLMMQVGGFGFMTGATALLSLLGRRIGFTQRLLVSESLGLEGPGGMVRLVRNMAVFTALAEGIGALIFFFLFLPSSPPLTALWQAVFHAVSTFNNAGFDLFGGFNSLTGFGGNAPVLLVTAALFILGGAGFIVLTDVYQTRKWEKLSLNSKLVIVASTVLLAGGTFVFLAAEYANPATLGPMSLPYKALNAFFHSATARTAGFNSLSTGAMREYSLLFTLVLMLIGGGAGSTASGIKVNTAGLIVATVVGTVKGQVHPGAFGREFRPEQILRAFAVLVFAMVAIMAAAFALVITDTSGLAAVLFESVSALSNCGLSVGITPALSMAGRLLIIVLMFIGRFGPLSLVLFLQVRPHPALYHYPEESVSIG